MIPSVCFLPSPIDTSTHSKVLSLVVVFAAISAPLKLKASRGPPTPINRNQASQPRGGQSMLGKRSFDTVSSLDIDRFHFCDVISRSSFIRTFLVVMSCPSILIQPVSGSGVLLLVCRLVWNCSVEGLYSSYCDQFIYDAQTTLNLVF